jgi:hypothetical protein
MHVLRTVPRGQLGLLIHDPRVPVIARPPTHEEGCRSVDDRTDGAISGALVMAIEEVENLVELLIGHGLDAVSTTRTLPSASRPSRSEWARLEG